MVYRESMRERQRKLSREINGCLEDDQQHRANIRRACLIEKWMDNKVCEEVVVRRKSLQDSLCFNSSSSSSDSSSGGGFSSSEAESVHRIPSRPKPVRTGFYNHDVHGWSGYGQKYQLDDSQSKPIHEDMLVKKKSIAMKICGNLKKAKQPISPGGRLAAFLNSLFTTRDTKKAKCSISASDRKSKSAGGSTCSSASSFSRSCLSKTPTSRGKLSNGTKRSVRFCPVSVILGEDCQPCGHKSLCQEEPESDLQAVKIDNNSISKEFRAQLMEKSRSIQDAARNLLKNYQKKVEREFDLISNGVIMGEDEENDDVVSYASSDLFELDSLSAIGMDKYGDELPVYETTDLHINRAIANGFLV